MKRPQSNGPRDRKKILILTASIGNGHLSVSRVLSEEIRRLSQGEVEVEVIDFMTEMKNFVMSTTKTVYLNTLKISPKIYEMFFSHSLGTEWPVKLLNFLNHSLIEKKFLKLLEDISPSVLVSTFPLWDFLTRKIWKKYIGARGKFAPFVSVITDSISVHRAYTMGNPDFYIAPNEDTKTTLQSYGVDEQKIKVLGYPISKKFTTPISELELEKKFNLSPKRKTLLLILSTGVSWSRAKEVLKALQKSSTKNVQLFVVANANKTWAKKIRKMKWNFPVQATGWTDDLHSLIKGADMVLTKAGGATVMECITSAKPLVIIEAIPGQEMGNLMMVQKYNLGVVLDRKITDIDASIQYILENEKLIKKNLQKLQRPEAGRDTAKFLLGLVK